MTLALPVTHPTQPGALLLRAGITLTGRMVEHLCDMRVPELWITCPGLQQICYSTDPGVQIARARVTRHIADMFDAASANIAIDIEYAEFRRTISTLVDRLSTPGGGSVFVSRLASAGSCAIRHATDVAYLSVLLGMKLDFYLLRERRQLSAARAKDVASLGVGAMLHDIGMTRLEPDVVARWRETGDELDPEWRSHVTLGYEMVAGRVDSAAAAAVLNHHQRYDGNGFPMRTGMTGDPMPVAGSDIHVFARIIAAADLYDRLLFPTGFAEGQVPAVRALRAIQFAPYRQRLDPVVLRALLAVCPPYPPGTRVTLNDGRVCVVSRWSPTDPCRPDLIEMKDPDEPGDLLHDEVIELSERPHLWVAEVDGHDVQQDNFRVEHIGGWAGTEAVTADPRVGADA